MYLYIYTYMYMCVCACMYVCMYVCIYSYIYVFVFVCVYIYIYICVYKYIYIYIHVNIYIDRQTDRFNLKQKYQEETNMVSGPKPKAARSNLHIPTAHSVRSYIPPPRIHRCTRCSRRSFRSSGSDRTRRRWEPRCTTEPEPTHPAVGKQALLVPAGSESICVSIYV